MRIFFLIFFLGFFYQSDGRTIDNIKIVNGEDAVQGQFPYQVLWAIESHEYYFVDCGGSIYNESTIITAAHCCKGFESPGSRPLNTTRIVAGQIKSNQTITDGQIKEIDSYLIHPDYTGVHNNFNDICLLTLKTNLEFNDNVKCIKLNDEYVEPDTKCVVSGWGRMSVSLD